MALDGGSLSIMAMATSDCEAIRDGWLAQPVNAWSSGAYLVAGGYLMTRHRALGAVAPGITLAVLALGAVAVGSFLYHGPQPVWGDAVHDASIAALLGTLACCRGVAGWMRDCHRRQSLAVVVVAAAAVLVVAVPSSVAAVHGALAGLVAVSAVRVARSDGAAPAVRVAPVALAVGLALFVLGRTGGPLCDPRSLAQPHAGWHLATAIAAAALVTIDGRPRRRSPTAP